MPSAATPAHFCAVVGMGVEGGNLDHAKRFAERLRAVGDEELIDAGDRAAFGGAGVEFAIGKRAGPALAETIVGFLDHAALAQQRREIEAARADVLAAFQHNRHDAQFQTSQRAKQARRTAADDDHPARVCGQGRCLPTRHFLGRQRAVDRDIQPQLHLDRALARIDRVFAQSGFPNPRDRNP